MTLFPTAALPQANWSDSIRRNAKKEVLEYMISQGADAHGLKDLASDIVDNEIRKEALRIKSALDKQGSLPHVFITDASKQNSIVNAALKSIEELDASGELEKMMKKIHDRIDRQENPEAYC